MGTQQRRRPILALTAAIAAVLIAGVAPALAHAELVSSDPAAGSTLATPPTTITLTFSEGVVAARSSFALTQGATTIGTGKAAADGDTTMVLDGLSLDPGDYVIQWTSVAADGDLLRGTVTFTVLQSSPGASTPAPSVGATDSGSAPPSAASTAPTQIAVTPSPQPSADAAPASAGGSDVLLPIVIGLLLVAGVGAYLLRRTRRT